MLEQILISGYQILLSVNGGVYTAVIMREKNDVPLVPYRQEIARGDGPDIDGAVANAVSRIHPVFVTP